MKTPNLCKDISIISAETKVLSVTEIRHTTLYMKAFKISLQSL